MLARLDPFPATTPGLSPPAHTRRNAPIGPSAPRSGALNSAPPLDPDAIAQRPPPPPRGLPPLPTRRLAGPIRTGGSSAPRSFPRPRRRGEAARLPGDRSRPRSRPRLDAAPLMVREDACDHPGLGHQPDDAPLAAASARRQLEAAAARRRLSVGGILFDSNAVGCARSARRRGRLISAAHRAATGVRGREKATNSRSCRLEVCEKRSPLTGERPACARRICPQRSRGPGRRRSSSARWPRPRRPS